MGGETVGQHTAVCAQKAAVEDLEAGAGQGHGLVEALAAALDAEGLGQLGLLGLDEGVYTKGVVQIQ